MLRIIKLFSVILICTCLSACGFALRQPKALAPKLQTMYVATATPNDPFVQQLDRILIANGITLVKNPKFAQSTLNILSIQTSNTMINAGGINVSGFYTAYFIVSFSVTDAQGKVLIPPTTLQQSQDFSSSASQVLSANAAAAQLTTSMQQSLAQNIVNQLAKIPSN
jgi:LPS-assembly lipoprotein